MAFVDYLSSLPLYIKKVFLFNAQINMTLIQENSNAINLKLRFPVDYA